MYYFKKTSRLVITNLFVVSLMFSCSLLLSKNNDETEKIDISTFILEYNISNIIYNQRNTSWSPSSSIPLNANASYTITNRNGTEAPSWFSMDGQYIQVEKTTPVGTYELKVTATAGFSNTYYTGIKTTEVTIVIIKSNISSRVFSYPTTTINISNKVSRTLNPYSNLPADAVNYSIKSVRKNGNSVDMALYSSIFVIDVDTGIITIHAIGDSSQDGTYELTVNADAKNKYTGERTAIAKFTILDVVDLSVITLTYPSVIYSTASQTLEQNIVPSEADPTFSISSGATTNAGNFSINGKSGAISVPSGIDVGSYELTIRVDAGYGINTYTGTYLGKVTILVEPKLLDDVTFVYDVSESIVYSIAKQFNLYTDANVIRDAQATFTISAKDSADSVPSGILLKASSSASNSLESSIYVSNNVDVGHYELTVSATPQNSNYSGQVSTNFTITVVPRSISDFMFTYEHSSPVINTQGLSIEAKTSTELPSTSITYAITSPPIAGITLLDSGSPTIQIARVTPANTYTVTVTGTGSGNYSGTIFASAEIVVDGDWSTGPDRTVLDTITTSVDSTDPSKSTITISWTAPVDMGVQSDGITKANLDYYAIYYRTGSTVGVNMGSFNVSIHAGIATQYTITGLDSEQEYAVIVVANNDNKKHSMGKNSLGIASNIANIETQ